MITKPKLLIVDDSRAFLEGLKSILSSAPFELLCLGSAKEALNSYSSLGPDIIITDLEMPEIHGFDFIKAIRRDPAMTTVPILVLTGSTDTESMATSIEFGADAFCAKETIRHTILPQLQALIRLKNTYESAVRGKQLEAVQALIGTYKHEFGNALAIAEGMSQKLCKNYAPNATDPAMVSLKGAIDRFHQTLNKLNELRHYQEEQYSLDSKILKVG